MNSVDVAREPSRGACVGRFLVTALVSAGRHVSVLQAREDLSFVALKLARTELGAERIEREARVLRMLGARDGPAARVLATGLAHDRRYSAMSFRQGVDLRGAGAAARQPGRLRELVGLCARIARAYAILHERGVVHGAVHPRHVVEDLDGSISVLDFATAASGADIPPPGWLAGRFNTLSPPEHAMAALDGEDPVATAAAEQYSVGALLYLLATGRMYAPLRLERRALAEDIIAARPAVERELSACPALGSALSPALRKIPAQRYPSMDAMARALEELPVGVTARRRTVPRPVTPALTQISEAFLRDCDTRDPIGSLRAPTCSVNFGAAGVAFALTRLGKVIDRPAALEQADRWLTAAEEHRTDADAFDDGDELTSRTVGLVSPYHTASGIAAVRAILSAARGDARRQQAALDRFRADTAAPCANLDLTLGRSSVLLFAALLYATADSGWPATQRLGDHGDHVCAEIWRDLPDTLPYYGIAHGWAGIAFATMMWSQARGSEPPGGVRRVLELLMNASEPWEGGLRWPLSPDGGPMPGQFWPGWCHGSAGYVFLWNLAEGIYGEDQFGAAAERTAELVEHSPGFTSLCCGSGGQVYALLSRYRSTGSERWRQRGIRLANDAAAHDELAGDSTTALSLYKSHMGLALLAAELERPEDASMPLFEFERTPHPAQT